MLLILNYVSERVVDIKVVNYSRLVLMYTYPCEQYLRTQFEILVYLSEEFTILEPELLQLHTCMTIITN